VKTALVLLDPGAAIPLPAPVVKNYEPVSGRILDNLRLDAQCFSPLTPEFLAVSRAEPALRGHRRLAAEDRCRKTPARDGRRPALRMGWRKLARVMLEVTA
jgi:hypothetical protein